MLISSRTKAYFAFDKCLPQPRFVWENDRENAKIQSADFVVLQKLHSVLDRRREKKEGREEEREEGRS